MLVANEKEDQQIIVKVVQSGMSKYYLHFETVWRALHIPKANYYRSLSPLIEYLQENTKPIKLSSYFPYQDYSLINYWWKMVLSPEQIVELLNKAEIGKESTTLKKIMDFLSTSDESVYKKHQTINVQVINQ